MKWGLSKPALPQKACHPERRLQRCRKGSSPPAAVGQALQKPGTAPCVIVLTRADTPLTKVSTMISAMKK